MTTPEARELRLQVQALITAGLHPDGVVDGLIGEAVAGDHENVARCLVDFMVAHTCVAPSVATPEDMLTFVVEATTRLMAVAAQLQGQDEWAYQRSLLGSASSGEDSTLPVAQALIALALSSEDLFVAALPTAAAGAHEVIESLANICLTIYADAAWSDPGMLLAELLLVALRIVHGIAAMSGCSADDVVTAYWEQLVFRDTQG